MNQDIEFPAPEEVKKEDALGFGVESNTELGTSILKEVFNDNIDLINNELQLEVQLDSGVRNKSWYRLHTKIVLDNERDINNQLNNFAKSFIKFRELMKRKINEL